MVGSTLQIRKRLYSHGREAKRCFLLCNLHYAKRQTVNILAHIKLLNYVENQNLQTGEYLSQYSDTLHITPIWLSGYSFSLVSIVYSI